MRSRPPVAFQSGGGVADAELGKKAPENAGGQKRRRGGEKDRVIHSCPKDLVPHRVKSTRKATPSW